ncbi:Similar to Helicase ARIP4; acc. no. A4IHD2 [Pyronema omphalodes CBS 100304]|uniref:Similar to Helicase ARIP4 acc. no. A4IHD2 n=1 Tax=Pyronema omphalodes (strain CBS 100304) TaxID=1076935 RepID=U4LQM7_PYROM|nr:Similar to Helicase ARIP4; acc. no. A4IHD2 [Pyronema omphalodes CBS 100304]
MTSQIRDLDPFDYSIERIVEEFHEFPDDFKSLLRSNLIDGGVLLTGDWPEMEEYLGISNVYGLRNKFRRIVRALQHRSPKSTHFLEKEPPIKLFGSPSRRDSIIQPNTSNFKADEETNTVQSPVVEAPPINQASVPEATPIPNEQQLPETITIPHQTENVIDAAPDSIQRIPTPFQRAVSERIYPQVIPSPGRTPNTSFQDDTGVEAAPPVDSADDDADVPMELATQDPPEAIAPATTVPVIDENGRKRLIPTFVRPSSPTRVYSKSEDSDDEETASDQSSDSEPLMNRIHGAWQSAQNEPAPQLQSPTSPPIGMAPVIDENGRKRLVPALVPPNRAKSTAIESAQTSEEEPILNKTRHQRQQGQSKYYLPLKSRKIDSIFYSVEPGEDIPDEEVKPFYFVAAHHPYRHPGERQFVARHLIRFFRNNSNIIAQDLQSIGATDRFIMTQTADHLRIAVKPYGDAETYLLKHELQSFTVFDFKNGQARVHRENTKTLPLPWKNSSSATSASSKSDVQMVTHFDQPSRIEHDDNDLAGFEHLLKWQNIDNADKILPLFGESDSEEEFDHGTWREYEKEFGSEKKVPKPRAGRCYVRREEIEQALQEAIEDVISRWFEKKLPKQEEIAYAEWTLAKKQRRFASIIESCTKAIEHAKHRLERQKDKFFEVTDYTTLTAAKKACKKVAKGNMKMTIESIQYDEWMIGLMKRKEAPPKPIRKPKAERKARSVPRDPGKDEPMDEDSETEDIGSSSDFISEGEAEDDMAGFISDNDVMDELMPEMAEKAMEDPDSESDSDSNNSLHRHVKSEFTPNNITGKNTPSKHEVIDLTLESSPPAKKKRDFRVIDLEEDTADRMNVDGPEEPEDLDPDEDTPLARLKNKKLRMESSKFVCLRSAIQRTPHITISRIRQRLQDYLEYQLQGTWDTMMKSLLTWPTDKRPELGHTPSEQALHSALCILYVAWAFRRSEKEIHIPLHEDDAKAQSFDRFKTFKLDFAEIMLEGLNAPENSGGKQSKRKRLRDKNLQVDDEEEEPEEESQTSHRKRKRKAVSEDQMAKSQREKQKLMMATIQRRIEEEKEEKGSAADEDYDKYILNKGHLAKYMDIIIEPRNVREEIKPHQIEGIRFLWTQLVQIGQNTGALLAHTMGLGKTLQVITFLYSLAVAGASQDKAVSGQIPSHLRKSKTLIMCPPTLIDNWVDEFHKWLPINADMKELDPQYIGRIHRADGEQTAPQRARAIHDWDENGGILIMSYHVFRQTVASDLGKILLEGPNIIVADEAHTIKNKGSQISKATSLFNSRSRIAMTGSPLSNNLEEYWTLIEWIDPGYLGPLNEFRAKYVGPIQDGLYLDSSHKEQRLSSIMLNVLKHDISYKINRADIEVIKDEMPQKTEFLITVPLTALQKEFYLQYINHPAVQNKTLTIFEVVNQLKLICNHPESFSLGLERRLEMEESQRKKVKRIMEAPEAELDDLDEEDIQAIGPALADNTAQIASIMAEIPLPLPELNYKWAREKMNKAGGNKVEQSYKMLATMDIIRYSLALNENILVFSHSIRTLDVLEGYFKAMEINYSRFDGSTQMNRRQQGTKDFNKAKGTVCLISTRAGGLGLNLYGASRVIILDFEYAPQWEQQAIGRAYRLGQKKHVFVYRLRVGGTFDDKVWNTAQFKTQLQKRVVDSRAPMRSSVKQWTEATAEPTEPPKTDLSEFQRIDPVLDQVIADSVKFDNYIRSIDHTDTFPPDNNDVLNEAEKLEVEVQLKQIKALRQEMEKQEMARKVGIPTASTVPFSTRLANAMATLPRTPIPVPHHSAMASPAVPGPSQPSAPSVPHPQPPKVPTPTPTSAASTPREPAPMAPMAAPGRVPVRFTVPSVLGSPAAANNSSIPTAASSVSRAPSSASVRPAATPIVSTPSTLLKMPTPPSTPAVSTPSTLPKKPTPPAARNPPSTSSSASNLASRSFHPIPINPIESTPSPTIKSPVHPPLSQDRPSIEPPRSAVVHTVGSGAGSGVGSGEGARTPVSNATSATPGTLSRTSSFPRPPSTQSHSRSGSVSKDGQKTSGQNKPTPGTISRTPSLHRPASAQGHSRSGSVSKNGKKTSGQNTPTPCATDAGKGPGLPGVFKRR